MATRKGGVTDPAGLMSRRRAADRSLASKSVTPARTQRGGSGTTVGGRGIDKPPRKKG